MSIINTVAAWDLMLFWNSIVPFEEFSIPGNGSTDFRFFAICIADRAANKWIYLLFSYDSK